MDGHGDGKKWWRLGRSFAAHGRAAAIVLSLYGAAASADYTVPANAVVSLDGGTLDLACTDLLVAGTLQLGSGQVLNARNVTLLPGGVLDGGSGGIQLGGDWSNSGSFLAGTGTVRFVDVCANGAGNISGATTFANARFVTSSGKNYVFSAGSVQSITGVLEITGTAAHPIQFRSSAPGQPAYINLAAAGSQQIVHVGVTDVWATGQFLAPGQRNEGGGGNANRWFGSPVPPAGEVIPVPALSALMQGVLAALLALAGGIFSRRRRSPHGADPAGRRRHAGKSRS